MVYIEGRLQTRSWDDKDTGAKRYKTEVNANDVQFLDSRQDGEGATRGADSGQPAGAAAAVPALGAGAGGDVDPDDIPF
jgi:single-strand DNA-binding protein